MASLKLRRDDFAEPIKRKLAHRVNHRCSNPTCRAATGGPQEDPSGTVNVGVGAHITAAAPGGPRYDGGLAALDRAGIQNGIWLCQNCAKLIDSDPGAYSAERLREWKKDAEAEAKHAIGKTATAQSRPKKDPISDKWVDIRYPQDHGLQAELEAAGYRIGWVSNKREARLIDIEGWEHALVKEPDGRPVRLKIDEGQGRYLVLLMKKAAK